MNLSGLAACMLFAAALLPWIPAWALWALAGAFFSGAFFLPKPLRRLFITLGICLLGCQWRVHPSGSDLRLRLKNRPQSVRLRFEIRGDSEVVHFSEQETEVRTPIRSSSLSRSGEWMEASGRIQLRRSSDREAKMLTGTLWEATGVLSPGNFSYVGLNRAAWKFVPDPGSIQPVAGDRGSLLLASLFRVRERLANEITRACADRPWTTPTLLALLLGQRNEVDPQTMNRFARTGLIHVFAISGLHLGLLAGLLIALCRVCGVRPGSYYIFVIPLLTVFTLYTGLRASALRALIMICCLLLAAPFKRKADLTSSFALALILILLISPSQIYDLGFQYSFLLVGSLLAFGKAFSGQLERLMAPDPWAVESPERRFFHQYLWPRLQGAVVVTGLCFVISAPLTAYTFNLFSPVALVGNLLAVPLAFLILATGFPALLTFFLPPAVSEFVFLPSTWSAEALLRWVDVLGEIPGGSQWVKAPALWMVCGFYGCLFVWWRWPALKLFAVACLLGLAAYAGTRSWLSSRAPQVGILNAERGQAAWFRLPGEGVVLVDCGSEWSGRTVTKHLKEQGIDQLDTLIFTHPDRNHAEGQKDLLEIYAPKQILVAQADLDHTLYADMGPGLVPVQQGDLFRCGGWNVEVLHPGKDSEGGSADSRSLVLRFSNGASAVLVMGGAGEEVERRLIADKVPLSSRVLLAGNPRRGAFTVLPFLQKVRPEVIVFSGVGFEGISPAREAAEAGGVEAGIRVLRVENSGLLLLNLHRESLEGSKSF